MGPSPDALTSKALRRHPEDRPGYQAGADSLVGRRRMQRGFRVTTRRLVIGLSVALVFALSLAWAAPASAAYSHMGEQDSNRFRFAHPEAGGTKLDSCTLCHTGGSVNGKSQGSCQWCHSKYGYDEPHGDVMLTLNQYGKDYLAAGRTSAAVLSIDATDSDLDGFKNGAEIKAIRFPGDATDDPTKIAASYRVYTRAQLMAMTAKTQFLAMNASKSDDAYSNYTGVTMEDLLAASGVLGSATGIKVYAPDGFSVYHPLDPPTSTVAGIYPVRMTYPNGTYLYNAVADIALNPMGGWVNYSSPGCAGRASGSEIVNAGGNKLMVAYMRDGSTLTTGVLTTTNKLDGEGPYRVVPPQVVPGPLDQRSTNSSSTLVWPYDTNLDHNAGYSSRSATIVKVEPLPAGTTDINVFEAGWDYIDEGKIVVYGALAPMPTSITINRSAASVRLPKTFTLSGVVSVGNIGDPCVVEVKKPRSPRWSYSSARGVGSLTATGGGNWWYRYAPKLKGTYSFRTKFAGDVARDLCCSRTISVLVK
jgi:hypothetical protein